MSRDTTTIQVAEDSVVLATGTTGPRGRSAYQVAVAEGFVGTTQDWLDSLVAAVDTAALDAHLDDTTDAHDASSISTAGATPTSNVQAELNDHDDRIIVLEDAPGGGVTDHGALTGLADDDHSQYHNDARGDARYWPLSTDLATQVELDAEAAARSAHIADTDDAHDASAISTTGATPGNVQANIDDHETRIGDLEDTPGGGGAVDSVNTQTGAVVLDAGDIGFTPDGSIAATTVQAAIVEVRDEAAGGTPAASAVSVDSTNLVGTGTDAQAVLEELDNGITDHTAGAFEVHSASAIAYAGSAGIAAVNVEAALDELDAEKANSADLREVVADPAGSTTINTSTPGDVAVVVVAEDVTTYTSGSNNYTAPTWATTVQIIVTGPGGAGGSGAIGASGTIRGGGGGGGHGELVDMTFATAGLTFPLACVVGNLSTVGASRASGTNNGFPGVVGTACTVTDPNVGLLAKARPGTPGAGGTNVVGGAGGANTIAMGRLGQNGSKGGGDTAAVSLADVGGVPGGGGGAQGMIASGNTVSLGSDGGTPGPSTAGAAAAANAPGAAGANRRIWGGGGGGGGRNTVGVFPVEGGAGGNPGGGGGGGGAAVDGQANGSGAGGAGGYGQIRIIARR